MSTFANKNSKMMKLIAIPTREDMVDDHFGHCAYYTVITLMLAGNMGMGAYNKLSAHGIAVIRGCQGKVDDILKAYLNGELKDSLESCDHHDCDHHQEKPVYFVPSFSK